MLTGRHKGDDIAGHQLYLLINKVLRAQQCWIGLPGPICPSRDMLLLPLLLRERFMDGPTPHLRTAIQIFPSSSYQGDRRRLLLECHQPIGGGSQEVTCRGVRCTLYKLPFAQNGSRGSPGFKTVPTKQSATNTRHITALRQVPLAGALKLTGHGRTGACRSKHPSSCIEMNIAESLAGYAGLKLESSMPWQG